MPKSYMTEADRQGLSQNAIYLPESLATNEAGDEETGWQWLALAEPAPASLMSCKAQAGRGFHPPKRFEHRTGGQGIQSRLAGRAMKTLVQSATASHDRIYAGRQTKTLGIVPT
jgi:hypothetical protein